MDVMLGFCWASKGNYSLITGSNVQVFCIFFWSLNAYYAYLSNFSLISIFFVIFLSFCRNYENHFAFWAKIVFTWCVVLQNPRALIKNWFKTHIGVSNIIRRFCIRCSYGYNQGNVYVLRDSSLKKVLFILRFNLNEAT